MKCPECKSKFPMQGNTQEEMDKTFLTCPECGTRFELQALQKMFLKGILIMMLAGIPLGLLPPVISIPAFIVVLMLLLKWVFKAENVVPGSKLEQETHNKSLKSGTPQSGAP